MKSLKLNINHIAVLFPFYVITDDSGRIISLGPSMQKIIGMQGKVEDVFVLTRPSGISFRELISLQKNEMIHLNMKDSLTKFTGQIFFQEESKQILFILNLIVKEASELSSLKLTFNDFAIHDPIFDFLMLLQTQKRALHQVEQLNQSLEKANAVAIKASETKSQFLANMSHELRTPLNGLLGMSHILKETELSEEQIDYLETIIKSGENMLSLVNDILDLSKIEAGHIQLDKEKTSLNDLFQDLHNTLYPLVKKKKIELIFHTSNASGLSIVTDPLRLRQALLNLLGNAVKFTQVGNVTLDFKVSNTNNILDLHFKIQDSGIGMSQEVISQLFKPFVQGDSSMSKKFEGTGLGLAICKKLVKAMGGDISVQSVEGKGSTFEFNVVVDPA